ncbi:MAG: hypothetical protein QOG23_2413 [Blastocatellia bacterium]|nr:hypothetical protein [Blastocatellia bacterium]
MIAGSNLVGGRRPTLVEERPSDSGVCRDVSSSSQTNAATNGGMLRVLPPPRGILYHAFHPGGEKGEEDAVLKDPSLVSRYANKVGHQPWFIYFSHEWGHESDRAADVLAHGFPLEAIRRIAAQGGTPFIRLMLRTSSDEARKTPEEYFTLENIVGSNPQNPEQRRITADIRRDLLEWGRVAREAYRKPLIVEWGTEANNKTFHWNADNQKGDHREATALFRRAFRYIVRTVSGDDPQRANIVWVFHVTAASDPDTTEPQYKDDWNRMADYYPDGRPDEDAGDVVDWLGVSIYGVDNLKTGDCATFSSQLDTALGSVDGRGSDERLIALAHRAGKGKPIFILEFGTALNYKVKEPKSQCVPQTWIDGAFEEMFAKADAGIISGFSWWNERYQGEGGKTLELRFDQLKLPAAGRRPSQEEKNNQAIVDRYASRLNDRHVVHAP